MKTIIAIAALFLLSGCSDRDIVSGVHGDHVTCISPAGEYNVYLPRATRYSIGEACPEGQRR